MSFTKAGNQKGMLATYSTSRIIETLSLIHI